MATVMTEIVNENALRSIANEADTAPLPLQPSTPKNADLPRAASYTYIPSAKDHSYTQRPGVLIKGSFSEHDLIAADEEVAEISPPESSGYTTPEEYDPQSQDERAQDLVAELHKSPKISVEPQTASTSDDSSTSVQDSSRHSQDSARSVSTTATATTVGTTSGTSTPRPKPSTKGSFVKSFGRSRFYGPSPSTSSPSSRSPSPVKNSVTLPTKGDSAEAEKQPFSTTVRQKSFLKRRKSSKPQGGQTTLPTIKQKHEPAASQDIARRGTILRGKSERPESGVFDVLTPPPAVPSVPKSFSTDRLPIARSRQPSVERAAPVPRLLTSSDKSAGFGVSLARKRDDLWNVFRTLDGDYAKFASKSTSLKANVVRNSLLPFLRTYATHPSNKTVRPEDLDRRANILNKWWTGMIEMLHGRNNQSISGTDRPAVLDGISGIMERPEWRMPPSPFCPLDQRTNGAASPLNRSTTSFGSSASEFLTESVHHNVRNIFVQNLSAQMAFVVDKMSMRNASASLVTFCGKACAYAFMFVPGMADVLVRLWEPSLDTVRRVLLENGVSRTENISSVSEKVIAAFPPALQPLSFSGLRQFMRKLRTPPPLPLGTANIEWWGHWLERWTGRESDLLYVFVKYFHILTQDFLPGTSTSMERICAPGLVLVHAQILTNLDATMHRDKSQSGDGRSLDGPSQTFDDMLQGDPDAVASTLPIVPTNAIRIMAENRFIMLIRDFLSDRLADHPAARRLFANSVNCLLQAVARGISMFDHTACYTLLDFMEEALPMLVRFENMFEGEERLVKPTFWKDVCRKMIESHNTVTEIRLYAFLYTAWNTVVCDDERKDDLCLGLLLDPEIFERSFNHWCPMVRAYFMRLLCWRVGRNDGESTESDVRIYETLLTRLQSSWAYYLYLREKAVEMDAAMPPTNPCLPAPNRRLLIMRTDSQPIIPSQSFISFDGVIQPPSPSAPSGQHSISAKRLSVLSTVAETATSSSLSRSESDSNLAPRKGFKGFLQNMLGGKGRSRSQGPPPSRSSSPASTQAPTAATTSPLTRSVTEGAEPSKTNAAQDSKKEAKLTHPAARNFSFKFSLEYQQNIKAPGQMRLLPPRLPLPAQRFLQESSKRFPELVRVRPVQPIGESVNRARYSGRALAEWMTVVGECQSFFDRRRNEGIAANKFVETPQLGIEVFKRPS